MRLTPLRIYYASVVIVGGLYVVIEFDPDLLGRRVQIVVSVLAVIQLAILLCMLLVILWMSVFPSSPDDSGPDN
jgi:hypothetical protein